jgi:hypothetical protein
MCVTEQRKTRSPWEETHPRYQWRIAGSSQREVCHPVAAGENADSNARMLRHPRWHSCPHDAVTRRPCAGCCLLSAAGHSQALARRRVLRHAQAHRAHNWGRSGRCCSAVCCALDPPVWFRLSCMQHINGGLEHAQRCWGLATVRLCMDQPGGDVMRACAQRHTTRRRIWQGNCHSTCAPHGGHASGKRSTCPYCGSRSNRAHMHRHGQVPRPCDVSRCVVRHVLGWGSVRV